MTHNIRFTDEDVRQIEARLGYDPLYRCNEDVEVLRIGIFFDGTGNSRTNIALGRQEGWRSDGGSYTNGHTSVARLARAYKNQRYVRDGKQHRSFGEYFEGSGMLSGEEDYTCGLALGIGRTGCLAQAHRGCVTLFEHVNNLKNAQNNRLEEVQVDVFGFSRGAATARHFANCIKVRGFFSSVMKTHRDIERGHETDGSTEEPSYSATEDSPHRTIPTIAAPYQLEHIIHTGSSIVNDIEMLIDVDFRVLGVPIKTTFLGMFDTVASVAERDEIQWSFGLGEPMMAVRNELTGHLNLHVSSDTADYAYHIVAEDEFRPNFSSYSAVRRRVSSPLTGNIDQISIPGSHADVGGSYWLTGETIIPIKPIHEIIPVEHTANPSSIYHAKAQRMKASFENSPRFKKYKHEDDHLEVVINRVENGVRYTSLRPNGEETILIGRRHSAAIAWVRPTVLPALQFVMQKLMGKKAIQNNVPFDEDEIEGIEIDSEDLQALYTGYHDEGARKSGDLDDDLIDRIKKKFVHYSAKYYWRAGPSNTNISRLPADLIDFDFDAASSFEFLGIRFNRHFEVYENEPPPPQEVTRTTVRGDVTDWDWEQPRVVHRNREDRAW